MKSNLSLFWVLSLKSLQLIFFVLLQYVKKTDSPDSVESFLEIVKFESSGKHKAYSKLKELYSVSLTILKCSFVQGSPSYVLFFEYYKVL